MFGAAGLLRRPETAAVRGKPHAVCSVGKSGRWEPQPKSEGIRKPFIPTDHRLKCALLDTESHIDVRRPFFGTAANSPTATTYIDCGDDRRQRFDCPAIKVQRTPARGMNRRACGSLRPAKIVCTLPPFKFDFFINPSLCDVQ